MTERKPQDFWPPLAAGVGLGLTLMGMFLFTGHGLGASDFFSRALAWLSATVAPDWTQMNSDLGNYLGASHPMNSWISWEIAGVAIGALIGSLIARRFRFKIERGPRAGVGLRLGTAVGGGMLSGFGASLAGGCTSGLGLSGGAVLAVAAFVFLMAFFIAGLLVATLTRRIWQ
jgi:uncharacterized membrane protein YedE/YeeE